MMLPVTLNYSFFSFYFLKTNFRLVAKLMYIKSFLVARKSLFCMSLIVALFIFSSFICFKF